MLTRIARTLSNLFKSGSAGRQASIEMSGAASNAAHPVAPGSITHEPTPVSISRSSTMNAFSQLSANNNIATAQMMQQASVPKLSQDNFVRVRIWASTDRAGQDTYAANVVLRGGNVGHATLETKNIYASIWPEKPVTFLNAHQAVDSRFEKNILDDVYAEGKEPDYIFTFYSLDSKAIEKMFRTIELSKEPWSLFGDLVTSRGYSCSSLTLSLLEHGGLDRLASQKVRGVVSPTSNLAVSPNNLINQLRLAAQVEKSKCPETLDFHSSKVDTRHGKKDSYILTILADKITINRTNEASLNEAVSNDPNINFRRL